MEPGIASPEKTVADMHESSDETALRDQRAMRLVRHLGSARGGLGEWRIQRWTALALIPLGLYFVASMLHLATSSELTAEQWLASPVAALFLVLLLLAGLAHMLVGLRSIVLDYVHTRVGLFVAGVVVRASTALLCLASLLAVIKIALKS
jgi:succinate dehydrogenase / fumarate reductase membrane anchor subunit